MRLKLVLNSYQPFINLPLHHNVTIQGMLYKSLPKILLDFLNEIGFFHTGKKFKPFTFSRIYSERFVLDKDKKRIKYKAPITIYLSSAVNGKAKNWDGSIPEGEKIQLGKNELFLEKIVVKREPEFGEEFYIRTLSPITVYRTFENENQKKFYQYYNPSQEEFEELIRDNLKKKYSFITGREIDHFPIKIESTERLRKVLIKYRDFPVEAYDGVFKIKTDPEMFKVVYDTGLGSKNSQGFGMIEVLNKN
ncbi:MAG: CRISPR-associated endoribonuclease Cas6 [Aquificae bacterium]|nr:CRISPR-associated endoribonuclease Cas6 [Aquificota bacterium]